MKIRNYSNLATVKGQIRDSLALFSSFFLSHFGHMHVKACFTFLKSKLYYKLEQNQG